MACNYMAAMRQLLAFKMCSAERERESDCCWNDRMKQHALLYNRTTYFVSNVQSFIIHSFMYSNTLIHTIHIPHSFIPVLQ